MALISGSKLGPYEIIAPLGAGGMGEVYRARDTRLDRTVAIKILSAHLAADPEARTRLDREARAISSLNHPNICHLYDVGLQDGTNFLVMEYLEGETLADRLRKGALPIEQFFKIGIEICEGLQSAHRNGVVHRDLKPGNIMLTSTGAKLMDFGLAKPLVSPATGGSGMTMTLSTPAVSQPLTAQGTVVGTFQYMSPEQLEGKEADGRSDIFALGAVLFEMLTGQRAFPGKSALSVASAILEKEPQSISTFRPATPAVLDGAIKRALAKDPEERWQTLRDLALELKWISSEGMQTSVPVPTESKGREKWAWGVAAALALLAAVLAIVLMKGSPKPSVAMRLTAETGADAKAYQGLGVSTILSPDGARLAFIATGSDEKRRIYIRPLDQLQASALAGTEDAESPFFSPDSQWVGFFAGGKLKKVAVQGGTAVTLCDAPSGRGGSWSEDGTIIFAPDLRSGLAKVPSGGGAPQPLVALDRTAGESTQRWPQYLPDGSAVLFTSNTHGGNYEDANIVVDSISSGERRILVRGGYFGRYVPTGHILYMHDGTLFAIAFDSKKLEETGSPVPLFSGIASDPGDASAQFSIAENGTFAYVPGESRIQLVAIYWMDREGRFTPLRGTPGNYFTPTFSPDGKHLAVAISDGTKSDVWVYDLARDTLVRLTFNGNNLGPIWTPDGQRVTYLHLEKAGVGDIYWTRADGGGTPLRLTEMNSIVYPDSWHPSGNLLAFDKTMPEVHASTFLLAVEGNDKQGWKGGEIKPLLSSSFTEFDPAFSPDGRWLAYGSNESGTFEVYVRQFPGPGGKWQVSSGGGGRYPKWSRTGKELFYRTTDNRIMVVPYSISGESFLPGKSELWSPGQFSQRLGTANFDLAPDGKRFVVLKTPPPKEGESGGKFSLIFDFFDELQSKAPQKK